MFQVASVSLDGKILFLQPSNGISNANNVVGTAIVGNASIRFIPQASLTGSPTLTVTDQFPAADTIRRSSGSWLSDGFAAGQFLRIASSQFNDGLVRIQSISSDGTLLTVTGDDTLQNETLLATALVVGEATMLRFSGGWTQDDFVESAQINVRNTSINDGQYEILDISSDDKAMRLSTGAKNLVIQAATAADIRMVDIGALIRVVVAPTAGQAPITAQTLEETMFSRVEQLAGLVDKIPLGAQVLLADTRSEIIVASGANITATGDVVIHSTADAVAALKMPALWLGITYVESDATANAILQPNAVINAGGNFSLLADVNHHMQSNVKAGTGLTQNSVSSHSV